MNHYDIIALIWFFVFGAAVGSFLNVVVYRLPRGKSLVWPPSHCPTCQTPIRWHDNLPILAWFALRGKCRACGAPIAFRYPAVEMATAALFVALGAGEFLTGAANLPERAVAVPGGVITPSLGTDQVLGIAVYHLVLLCTLLAAALIEYDGLRLPRSLLVVLGAVGLSAGTAFPWLRPDPVSLRLEGWEAGLVDGLAGALGGALAGAVVWLIVGRRHGPELVAVMAGVGAFLGVPAVLWIALATLVLHLPLVVLRSTGKVASRITPLAGVTVSTCVWILAWRDLANRLP